MSEKFPWRKLEKRRVLICAVEESREEACSVIHCEESPRRGVRREPFVVDREAGAIAAEVKIEAQDHYQIFQVGVMLQSCLCCQVGVHCYWRHCLEVL